jgi:Papain-like cysteine protease AvrRpt2
MSSFDQTRIPLDLSDYAGPALRWRRLLDRWSWVWQRILGLLECLLKLWRRLALAMQPQLQSQWCWAACATSVSLFYDGASTWTQCSVVNTELGQTTCCQDGSTSQCNQPWYLDKALTRTGNLASWAAGTTTIAQIRSQVASGRPVGARIGWSGGGGHFVMIAGYRACDPDGYIDVRDPIYGSSDVSLATFTSSYHGTGSWTHTYYTEP